MNRRTLDVRGASEHNLREVDVSFGPGLTAVVGVSGSGKSSLAFDVVYHEARRRLMQSLALGAASASLPPARVRRIDGLGPAVAVAQNVLNHNPSSTVATSIGLHPFLRILWSRFAEVSCPSCDVAVRAVSEEERLRVAMEMLVEDGRLAVEVAIVRGVTGSHARLLAGLRGVFDVVTVDGRRWKTTTRAPKLDPSVPHDVVVPAGHVDTGATPAEVRAALEHSDGLGSQELRLNGRPVLRAPVCPGCGSWVRPLEPTAFRIGGPDTSSHRLGGLTITDLVARPVTAALEFAEGLPPGRLRDEVVRRLGPLATLGLGHLTLDRPMPTLSRGEAQRTRLAVVLAGRLEDLLHVLDEPTIGLHHTDLRRLLDAVASLPGPVVMVEHDRTAVAMADDVVEIGPSGGRAGGTLVFQGPPAALWKTDTASGRGFSAGAATARARRTPGDARIRVTRAAARNLDGFDCEVPLGLLTVVTGPSGAGKTTLTRDVMLASLECGSPVGCDGLDAPKLRAIAVDQSPLGNNPRSNPATYTKVFDGIRDLFARETARSKSEFTFNRSEGACPDCEGMGAVEIALRYVAPVWVPCEACEGRRYRPEVLDFRYEGLSIADVLDLSVDEACDLFAGERAIMRGLGLLQDVGLGYVHLGQPSPSLSGGEAQRVRLTRAVSRAKAGDLVLLDEPTTGLHPADLGRLVGVLDRLTENGCTVVVVEHQPDVIAAADWVIDLGPGGGPEGGRLMHCGVPPKASKPTVRPRAKPRRRPRASAAITVRGARAHNLRSVDVDFVKNRFTVVTGVSGSGKSSLVDDVVAAEATRRLLECLSVYERQSVREGPEAPVDTLTGIGPAMIVDASTGIADRADAARSTVARSSGLDRLVALVMARAGVRTCLECGRDTVRRTSPLPEAKWACDDCGASAVPIEPRHITGSPAAICTTCVGLGTLRRPVTEKLVARPDRPICAGCFGGNGLVHAFCDEKLSGIRSLRAFARRHGFDPKTTPWSELSDDVRHKFVFGDPEPFALSDGGPGFFRREGDTWRWRGFVPWAIGDLGSSWTESSPCPGCAGKRLRAPYLSIRLAGRDRAELFSASLAEAHESLASIDSPADAAAAEARATAMHRLAFLRSVGLGYLHLDRTTWTLSAGEAQRIKLASVLGGGLVGTTVLVDEPSRGLHPSEVGALARTLTELRDAGNTVIAVDHDPTFIRAADDVVEIGPGPGRDGGRLVALSAQESVTRAVLDGRVPPVRREHSAPARWMHVTGARENNLRSLDVRIPLGVRTGVCGVSGSGKSSLVVDTIALALARPDDPPPGGVVRVEPGSHDAIAGAPPRTVVADQSRAAVTSPGMFLGLVGAVRRRFAANEVALEQGVMLSDLAYRCDGCRGRGTWQESMSFLPSVTQTCDACGGSGYRAEVASLVERGRTLAETERLSIAELTGEWGDVETVRRAGEAAIALGLGYLVVRQPGWSLSGGEAQRLKLAKGLAQRATDATLYVLDEPTVGLQATDVAVLAGALDAIVGGGNSVLVVEHDPYLLASCDWLVELGPGAGPEGGRIVFEGTPEQLADADTPTAPFVRAVLA